MMRRKSPRSENIYLIENHCQANISKGRRGKDFKFFHERDMIIVRCMHVTMTLPKYITLAEMPASPGILQYIKS